MTSLCGCMNDAAGEAELTRDDHSDDLKGVFGGCGAAGTAAGPVEGFLGSLGRCGGASGGSGSVPAAWDRCSCLLDVDVDVDGLETGGKECSCLLGVDVDVDGLETGGRDGRAGGEKEVVLGLEELNKLDEEVVGK